MRWLLHYNLGDHGGMSGEKWYSIPVLSLMPRAGTLNDENDLGQVPCRLSLWFRLS